MSTIENDMAFLLGGSLRPAIQLEAALKHVKKAGNLLKNAGFDNESESLEKLTDSILNKEDDLDDLKNILELK